MNHEMLVSEESAQGSKRRKHRDVPTKSSSSESESDSNFCVRNDMARARGHATPRTGVEVCFWRAVGRSVRCRLQWPGSPRETPESSSRREVGTARTRKRDDTNPIMSGRTWGSSDASSGHQHNQYHHQQPTHVHAAHMREQSFETVEQVVLDGLVVLKIVKHCKEALPAVVSGKLLGLEFDGKVEVTNCFAMPTAGEESDDNSCMFILHNYVCARSRDSSTPPSLDRVDLFFYPLSYPFIVTCPALCAIQPTSWK